MRWETDTICYNVIVALSLPDVPSTPYSLKESQSSSRSSLTGRKIIILFSFSLRRALHSLLPKGVPVLLPEPCSDLAGWRACGCLRGFGHLSWWEIVYTEKTRILFPFKLNGIWLWWQFSFQFWAKWNSIWFKIERKTVTTIISHSIWKEIEYEFSQCKVVDVIRTGSRSYLCAAVYKSRYSPLNRCTL